MAAFLVALLTMLFFDISSAMFRWSNVNRSDCCKRLYHRSQHTPAPIVAISTINHVSANPLLPPDHGCSWTFVLSPDASLKTKDDLFDFMLGNSMCI